MFSLKENANIITEGTGEGSFVIGLERRLFEKNVPATKKKMYEVFLIKVNVLVNTILKK